MDVYGGDLDPLHVVVNAATTTCSYNQGTQCHAATMDGYST